MKRLKAKGIEVLVYEPELSEDNFYNSEVIRDIKSFKKRSEIIVANRLSNELIDCNEKIFTRDIFKDN